MTYDEFRIAIVQRLRGFSALGGRINWPNNTVFDPDDPDDVFEGLWARVHYEYAGALPVGFGNGLWTRQVGNIIIALYDRRGASDANITNLASRVAAHFQFYSEGTLECLDVTIRVVGEDDGWYRINVIIPFRYDQESQL